MQIHQIKPSHKLSKKRRIGRGGKRGTYSGRGIKGQKSRAGSKIKPQIRELISKFPKKRGLRFKTLKKEVFVVRLNDVVKAFPQGGIVNPKKLRKANLIKRVEGKLPRVKILGALLLSAKYTVKNCLVSKKVEEAIIKAEGKIDSKIK